MKAKHRQIRLGEAQKGLLVWYLNDLNLPPIAATVVEAGEIQEGGFQRYQDIWLRVHEFSRIDHATVMESGSERVLVQMVERFKKR